MRETRDQIWGCRCLGSLDRPTWGCSCRCCPASLRFGSRPCRVAPGLCRCWWCWQKTLCECSAGPAATRGWRRCWCESRNRVPTCCRGCHRWRSTRRRTGTESTAWLFLGGPSSLLQRRGMRSATNRWLNRFGVRLQVLTGRGGVTVDFNFTEGEDSRLSGQGQRHVTPLHTCGEVVGVLFPHIGDGSQASAARTQQITLTELHSCEKATISKIYHRQRWTHHLEEKDDSYICISLTLGYFWESCRCGSSRRTAWPCNSPACWWWWWRWWCRSPAGPQSTRALPVLWCGNTTRVRSSLHGCHQ